jgi:hypothetical protein
MAKMNWSLRDLYRTRRGGGDKVEFPVGTGDPDAGAVRVLVLAEIDMGKRNFQSAIPANARPSFSRSSSGA